FSGLVKAIDPLGLSYKMQEFFDLWHINQLNQYTLWFSIIIIAFEIIAGVALLLGWQMKLFSWLLLLLIIFFTFLTGFAYLSGKFKNCGCFGDCIPITPLASFLKDILLMVLIGFLFFNRQKIKPVFSNSVTFISMLAATVLSFGLQWYVLNYLPIVDCLPFKKGNNIMEKMKIPAGAVPDSFAIMFVYEKNGKQFEFSPSELPADLATYKFVNRKDKLIRKGNAEPPIKGFSLSGQSNIDSTQIVLTQPYSILFFCENFNTPVSNWKNDFEKLYTEAKQKNISVYIVTTTLDEANKVLTATPFSGIPVFKCDYTAIRTAARTNPCLYLLKQGTIVNKWSYKNLEAATHNIRFVPVQNVEPKNIQLPIDSINRQP
ncbi:MAG: DoxX family protein, partial [Bacteroidota bacterium]|nr:DoxX family protein [Bacteroidota bacterium]